MASEKQKGKLCMQCILIRLHYLRNGDVWVIHLVWDFFLYSLVSVKGNINIYNYWQNVALSIDACCTLPICI